MLSNQQSSRLRADAVSRQIRSEIVTGQRLPGSQLETWDAMEVRFGVGRTTLMRALNRLKRDGFVVADSTRGTFVGEKPPHLSRYGVAFQSRPGSKSLFGWNRFWQALLSVATEMEASGERKMPCFYDITNHVDDPDQKRLADDILHDRLAGVIFVGPIEDMSSHSLQLVELPKVSISFLSSTNAGSGYPRVYVDCASFVTRACDYLASRNCKKVAVLTLYDNFFTDFEQQIAARGMTTRPYWQLPIDAIRPNAAFAATRLLLDRGYAERPDALVVCDDNMVESAMAAVVDAGVRVPQELEIVTHCNWQERWPTVLPTKRLGYDARAVMSAAIQQIDLQRQNQAPSLWTGVPAQFEEELAQR